jgi:CubicO group peptidase (beta-lactamase class C family)
MNGFEIHPQENINAMDISKINEHQMSDVLKIKKNHLILLILLVLLVPLGFVRADVVDSAGTHWPIPDWRIEQANTFSKTCNAFLNFATKSDNFLTEGLVIIKDGKLVYESYDEKYHAKTPHVLWSVSKTITGALLGVAVKENKLELDDYLNYFYPLATQDPQFQKIQIKNLFYLDSGFIWDEYYSGDVRKSPVLNMLYGSGYLDIEKYAATRPIIKEGPGFKWNYSTGTPAITMGVLKKVYGNEYDKMPWNSFFNLISMNHVSFERDHQGVFGGGSSVFASPRDMAKIGYLYLNRGKWNDVEVLPESWIEKTLQVSPGYLSDGTIIHDITDDGVYGGSIWLNRFVKHGFGKPYPSSPDDMFLAIGHYGQMIIVLPTQKMVIARTGYDQEYNSKIDQFVSRAISCFDNPNYPIGKNIPPPKSSKSSIFIIFNTIKTGLETNILQNAVAKTVCSCHFISGIDKNTCINRSNIPFAKNLTNIYINNNIVYAKQSKLAKLLTKVFGLKYNIESQASFDLIHPEFGCTLK